MTVSIYRGTAIFTAEKDRFTVYPGAYVVVEDGFVKYVLKNLPEDYTGIAVKDFGDALIIPAFSDLHIHASQYAQRGIGIDKLLFDWLNDYTFPQEAKFADCSYAEKVYDALVKDLIRHGTFHASIFTTIHSEASDCLFRKLAERGLYAYTGKVNMDCNSPDYLCEKTEESLRDTERFLLEHQGCATVKPILIPRFAPTCSEKLIQGLGKLAKKYACGVQTHLVESIAEAAWTKKLFPGYSCETAIYEQAGLMENGPTVFAHVIFPTEEDISILQKAGSISVHCPDATANVTAGIMPAATLRKHEMNIALGTDIGAGAHPAVYRQIARAVQLSKLKAFFEPEGNEPVSFAEAFYMATKAGGSIFDRVGSLEPGYRFNALVLDGLADDFSPLTPEEQLERFCYAGDDRNIIARYLDGKQINP